MNQKELFGMRLKEARERKNLSQKALTELMNDGVNQSLLSKYESGTLMPRPDRMKRFASVLEVSEAWLRAIYGNEEPDELQPIGLKKRPGTTNQLELLKEKNEALQRSELEWQRKELQAQRELVELKGELLRRDTIATHLLEALTGHLRGLEALIPTLTPEQRKIAIHERNSLAHNLNELQVSRDPVGTTNDSLKTILDDLENLFKEDAVK